MWTQLLIGVGGMVVFALGFAAFQTLANRVRAMGGECRMDSVRCLGCLATGRCRALEAKTAPNPNRAGAQGRATLRAR